MEWPETRVLSYFVAVAEELHFGRAAAKLGMTQPPLSRAIRQLEGRLGVVLIERTSRTLRLTPAGKVLLRDSRAALQAVAAAANRARRTGSADPRLILTLKPGADAGMLPDILTEFETCPEALPVEIVFSVSERAAMLRDGRADVGLLHSPNNDLVGLDVEELLTERQIVVLPERHRLTDLTDVRMADLADERMPRWPEEAGGSGENRDSPVVHDTVQLMHLIALGRMVALLPESVRERLPTGLTYRPVPDARPTTLVVAWPSASTSRHVAAFVRAAVVASRAR
jgi:DNA-binding transcriptional LysR family regulator